MFDIDSAVRTLADLVEAYLRSLSSPGTVHSYRIELAVALDELGRDTLIREPTPERIEAFTASDRVTRARAGVAKAPVSVAKTRSVVRQALAWREGAMAAGG